ncbi:MAG: prolyl oligopeptidase family serine peptidase [Verrucomicrobiota bacterium]
MSAHRFFPLLAALFFGLVPSESFGQKDGLEPETLLRPATISSVSMSPDGKNISYTLEIKGEREIILLDEELNPRRLTAGKSLELSRSIWGSNEVLYIQVARETRSLRTGGRPTRYMRYDLTTPKKGLKPFLSDSFDYGGTFKAIPNAGKTSLISSPYYYRKWFDSKPFVIDSGTRKIERPKVGRPDDMHGWVIEKSGYPKIGYPRFSNDGKFWIQQDEDWDYTQISEGITPFWYNSERDVLAVDNRALGTNQIVRYDFVDNKVSEVILKDEVYDVANRSPFHRYVKSGTVYSPKDGTVIAISAPRSHNGGQAIIDSKWKKLMNFVKSQTGAKYVRVVSISADGNKSIFETGGPTDPDSFYLLDLKAKSLDYMFSRREWLKSDVLTEPEQLEIPVASIGLNLRGNFYKNSEESPTLVIVDVSWSGIPEEIRTFYSPSIQYYLSQGFNVVDLSLPGTPGYGRAYYEGGEKALMGDHVLAIDAAANYMKEFKLSESAPIILYSYGAASITAAKLLSTDTHKFDGWISGNALYDWPERRKRRNISWESDFGFRTKLWIGDPFEEGSDFHQAHCRETIPALTVPTVVYGAEENDEIIDAAVDGLKVSQIPYKVKVFDRRANDFENLEDTQAYYEEIVALLNWLVKQGQS